ncbi:MAG: glycine--tRNA ligase subunit beta [Limnochordia bacterium]
MRSLLLEVGFEELPARFVSSAVQQLAGGITARLRELNLSHGNVTVYSTPRRLAVKVADLVEVQPDRESEIKGPPKNIAFDAEGQLTKAGAGFARSQGVSQEELFVKSVQGVEYLFARKFYQGQATVSLLPEVLSGAILALSFPKNMRWGDYDLRFARPLRWIVALFGCDVVPFSVGSVAAGRRSWGHRQLSQGPIDLNHADEYVTRLADGYVMVEADRRRQTIIDQVTALAKAQGGKALLDDALVGEVTNLVEYPTSFCGSFQEEYLEVPAEVLVTTMKEHQRYFPIYGSDGRLLPMFIGVRNGADNHLDIVVRGNEKVLAARLADAKFFYDEDCKQSLEANLTKLEGVVFQEGLGTMSDKVARLVRLAPQLAEVLGEAAHARSVERTALLCKADLATQMVYEFPELQGTMGEKYALLSGESPQVARGIAEHYKPRFAGDSLPESVEGKLVGLADKIDTLVGYFALGKIPTGSQDPFALRRQAQGVVQILLANQYDLSLRKLVDLAAEGYSEVSLPAEYHAELVDFLLARLRVYLLDQGLSYDTVDAVLASKEDRVPRLAAKAAALEAFRGEPQFVDLHTAFERAANLAAKTESVVYNEECFVQADREFFKALSHLKETVPQALEDGLYRAALTALAEFREPVDRFFDQVMIMDKDEKVRQNRLSMLLETATVFRTFADFQAIVVSL